MLPAIPPNQKNRNKLKPPERQPAIPKPQPRVRGNPTALHRNHPPAKRQVKARARLRGKARDKLHRSRERAQRPEKAAGKAPDKVNYRAKVRGSRHQGSLAKSNRRDRGREEVKDKVNLTRERVKGVAPMPRPAAGIALQVDVGVRRPP